MNKLYKLLALRTDPLCFLLRFLFQLEEVIFSSKPLKKSSTKMFPFYFQRSVDNSGVFEPFERCLVLCSGFSVAMGDSRPEFTQALKRGTKDKFCN